MGQDRWPMKSGGFSFIHRRSDRFVFGSGRSRLVEVGEECALSLSLGIYCSLALHAGSVRGEEQVYGVARRYMNMDRLEKTVASCNPFHTNSNAKAITMRSIFTINLALRMAG
jgi:hypothetical protein